MYSKISFVTDAYASKHHIGIEMVDEKNTTIMIGLKHLSPYVDNSIKYNINDGKDIYTITPLIDPLHDRMIPIHILNSVLNRFEKEVVPLNQYMDVLNRTNNLIIQKKDLEHFIECLVIDVNQNFASYHRMCPQCFTLKPIDTLIITPCDKCIPDSFNKIYSNVVTDLYAKDINQFKLLLYTSLKAVDNKLDNKQRFVPIPRYCDSPSTSQSIGSQYVSRDFSYYLHNVYMSSDDKDLMKRIKEKDHHI